jgi:hypothetical protein
MEARAGQEYENHGPFGIKEDFSERTVVLPGDQGQSDGTVSLGL